MLYGKFALDGSIGGERSFYFLCLGFLLLVLAAAASFRRHHSGRVLIALRDNQRAASSYSIAPVRSRLAAFAVSGAIAGLAGVLFAYQQHNVIPGTYDVYGSIAVFLAAAVGGLGSLAFATIAVVLFQATILWGPMAWHHLGHTFSSVVPLLITGPLLILNLYSNPGGLAGWAFAERDKWLRRLAARASDPRPVPGRRQPRRRGTDRPGRPAGTGARDMSHLAPPTRSRHRRGALSERGRTVRGEPILSCRGVDVAYDKVQVLFGVDLDVRRGEIVALLGTNGAGKSTLLKAISGAGAPGRRPILFDGATSPRPTPQRPPRAASCRCRAARRSSRP